MKSISKRILAIIMVLSLFICSAISASAQEVLPYAEEKSVSVVNNDGGTVSPLNAPVAFNAGNLSGGYGTVTVELSRYISSGYFQAAVSPNSNSGGVRCGVRYPSGTYASIGSVPASGGSTSLYPVYSLSPGTYTFTFTWSNTSTINAQGYIF